jgi:cytochrome c peroxidase
MRKIHIAFLLVLFGFGVFVATAFRTPPVAPAQQVTNRYKELLEAFARNVQDLHRAAALLKNTPADLKNLRKTFQDTRFGYKNVEFLLAYIENEEVEGTINGGPLPSVNAESEGLEIVEPCGLQTLEEIVYSDSALYKKAEIVALTQKLTTDFKEISERQERMVLTDKIIFEAVRLEMVRLATMGISGFDTPASQVAIWECEKGFGAATLALMPYFDAFSTKENEKAANLFKKIENARQFFIKNNDFESFDRATCIKTYLNPLYSDILDMQMALNIDTKPSKYAETASVNLLSRNIFDKNFLNTDFFTQLKPEEKTNQVVELGKMLFFDPLLSANNQRACASCHDPSLGFADAKRKSIAIDKATTVARNAPTIVNAVFAAKWFYDLRSGDMKDQIKQVIGSEKEFHSDYATIVKKLNSSPFYKKLFKNAFKSNISEQNIGTAIVAYEESLVALSSPFDRYMRGETAQINPAILRGFNLFTGQGNCATCHFAPTFSGLVPPFYHENESEVLGVPIADEAENATIDDDLGRFNNKIAKDKVDFLKYSFKTPTLRNINYTAPYMHNGVFKTLDDVMIFYNKGGGAGIGIDLPHQTLSKDVLALTPEQRDDVIAFMQSLSDTTGTNSAPKYLPKMNFLKKDLNKRKIGGVF